MCIELARYYIYITMCSQLHVHYSIESYLTIDENY